jgi:hypothetical protein
MRGVCRRRASGHARRPRVDGRDRAGCTSPSTIHPAGANRGPVCCGGPRPTPRLWMWIAAGRRFRMIKQTFGWTVPQLRGPAAADRWTWLILTAHTRLRLARPLAADLGRPWERPVPAERLSPARVRRGFRNLGAASDTPACAPKPSRPGPERPPGSRNRHTATRRDLGLIIVTGRPYHRPALPPAGPPQEGHQTPPHELKHKPTRRTTC